MGGWSSSPSTGGGSGFAGSYNSGTITADTPITFTQTWNNSGVAFTAYKVNVTATAAQNGSLLMDLQVAGASKFKVDQFGSVSIGSLSLSSTGASFSDWAASFGFSSGSAWAHDSSSGNLRISFGSGKNRVNFGGNTSSFPALKLNGANLEVRLADDSAFTDMRLRNVIQNPAASVTPTSNGELVVEATSNTTLTFKLKGTDGTVRSATLTLA